jgi:hypothetical protein
MNTMMVREAGVEMMPVLKVKGARTGMKLLAGAIDVAAFFFMCKLHLDRRRGSLLFVLSVFIFTFAP